jgi:hypothetical protein
MGEIDPVYNVSIIFPVILEGSWCNLPFFVNDIVLLSKMCKLCYHYDVDGKNNVFAMWRLL